jgi:predicted lipoprotein with Yx(FWY)xxD motif
LDDLFLPLLKGDLPMRSKWLAAGLLTSAVLVTAACSSSSSSSSSSSPASTSTGQGSSATALKSATISGTAVVTNAAGFTLYWFVPDTATKSNCNGSCAQIWPPVKGPATAGTGVTGTLGTITRSDGSTQATYDGHPLYTYAADTAPGQANGNGINANGGVWHEVTVSGAVASAASPSSGGGGGGY